MEDLLGIVEILLATVIGIIGYFIKKIIEDVKTHQSNLGELKGKIEVMEIKADSQIEKLAEKTELQIQQLTTNVNDLTKAMEMFNTRYEQSSQNMSRVLERIENKI